MFDLKKLTVTPEEKEQTGLLEKYIEERSYDWCITYYVYADKVDAVESMGDNSEHCVETCKDLEEALSAASEWC